jgi:hypothetical protein
MQVPIPQSGPRSSPDTDRPKLFIPAIAIAAATIVPDATVNCLPFTRTVMFAVINK